MFDYSKAAGNLILEDLKKWRNRFQIFFSLFTLAYLAYCLIRPVGIFYINLALAVIYIAYTVFQLITYKKENKRIKKRVARTYKWARLLLRAVTLVGALYGIYVASAAVDGISLILATLTIIMWILQVLFEILTIVIEPRIRLLSAGVMEDVRPVVTALKKMHLSDNDWNYEAYQREREILERRIVIDEAARAMEKKNKKSPFKTTVDKIKSKIMQRRS